MKKFLISVGAKAAGPAACTGFPEREKGEYVRFNRSNVIAIVALFIALMLSGAPPMRGQAVDTIPAKWIHWTYNLGAHIPDAKFHPNGNILAAVNTDVGEIWELDPNTGEILRIMEQPDSAKKSPIKTLEISPDGSKLIVKSLYVAGRIIYDYQTGNLEKNLKTNIYDYTFFPGTKRIIGIIDTILPPPPDYRSVPRIAIYDIEQDSLLATYKPSYKGYSDPWLILTNMRMSPDGRFIVMVFINGSSKKMWYESIWSTDSMKEIQGISFHNVVNGIGGDTKVPNEIKWSKDSKYVGFLSTHESGSDYELKVFNVSEWINSQMQSGKYVFNDCYSFDFTADSKYVIICPHSTQQYSKMIDIKTGIISAFFERFPIIFDVQNNNFVAMSGGIHYYDISSVGVKTSTLPITPIKSVLYKQGKLTITLNTIQPVSKVTITDILGKILFQAPQMPNTSGLIEIPLPLPIGTYFITIQIGKSVYNSKFMVVR